jgi:hypothetical protein
MDVGPSCIVLLLCCVTVRYRNRVGTGKRPEYQALAAANLAILLF